MSRRLASTPSAEKSQAQANFGGIEGEQSKDGEQGRSSPRSSESATGNLRPNEEFAQQAAAQGGLSGSAVDDTPMKDEGDEPEYSPPGASPLDPGSGQISVPKKEDSVVPATSGMTHIPAEVSQVLAQLAQLSGK